MIHVYGTHLGLNSSDRICLITCFKGHSSSIYNLAIRAFFFSHTSEEIEVFMVNTSSVWINQTRSIEKSD